VPKPDEPPQLGLEALDSAALPEGAGLVAIAQTTPPDAPTPLATALIAGLAGPVVRTDILLATMQSQLSDGKVTVVLHPSARPGFLAGAPPPPPEPPKPPPAPPVVSAVVPPVAVQPPPLPPPPAVVVPMPDEDQMTVDDRRAMQSVLARIGYYAAPLDGIIGPETRAAIRRYQHEIGAEVTGHLTAAQATKLFSNR
jgi:Putative peptidoglycan binding domain